MTRPLWGDQHRHRHGGVIKYIAVHFFLKTLRTLRWTKYFTQILATLKVKMNTMSDKSLQVEKQSIYTTFPIFESLLLSLLLFSALWHEPTLVTTKTNTRSQALCSNLKTFETYERIWQCQTTGDTHRGGRSFQVCWKNRKPSRAADGTLPGSRLVFEMPQLPFWPSSQHILRKWPSEKLPLRAHNRKSSRTPLSL